MANGTNLIVRPLGPLAAAITNLFQSPPTDIRGIETTDWFGPLQPVHPIAPEGTEPRRFQYYPGQNLIHTPRADEDLSSDQLRGAAKYPLARILIENVKDMICRLPITVRLRQMPGETGKEYAKRKPDPAILRDVGDIIENPNPDQNRQEFMRQLVDDLLILDAASVLFRTTKSGKLVELRAIDGATITRYIDEQGYTPQPPSPAYAQVWYGIPMVNLTTKQLLYAARNILPGRIYGTGPTEQAMKWIAIGIERLEFKHSAYKDGTIPDGIQVVPAGVTADIIAEAQQWMTSDLAGQLAKRRQLRMIQGFSQEGKDQFLFPKQALLADQYDELEINSFCFAYGVSRQRLAKMMNRASAQSDQEAADREGLQPWLDWATASVWNKIIRGYLGFKEYEAIYEDDRATEPYKQAQIDEIRVKTGQKTINEVRDDNGDDPRDEPEADMLMIQTATGPIPLSVDKEIERNKKKQASGLAAPGAPKPDAPDNPGESAPGASDNKTFIASLQKLNLAARKILNRNGHQGANGNGNGRGNFSKLESGMAELKTEISRLNTKEPAKQPDINVSVEQPKIEVNIPERQHTTTIEGATFNVAPTHVDMHVPPAPANPPITVIPPAIDVHVPVQPAPTINVQAPRVTVTPPNVEVKVEQPKKSKRVKRVSRDAEGNITKITEEDTDE